MNTLQCSKSLVCKSSDCHHAKPHSPDLPHYCEKPAPCGRFTGRPDLYHVVCIPVEQVRKAREASANRTTDPAVVGEKLRQTRLKLGLTQGEMARLFDIPVNKMQEDL